MRSRAYGSVAVNHVDVAKLTSGREGSELVVGMDIGKYQLMAVARWPDGEFERPCLVKNPEELPDLLALLRRLGQDHTVTVALEPSGT